jgi:fructokinase
MDVYGGIEGGGTKFVCAVGPNPEDIRNIIKLKTTSPEETIGKIIEFFKEQNKKEKIKALGIGSFGPVDLNEKSSTYGYITSTPKTNWQNTNLYGKMRAALNIPVGFDTDVNAAALGEYEWGAARGLNNFIYITIGCGIGGGGMINGSLLHGLMHPEMGHIFIPRDRKADPFEGVCPFHKDCFEGLASGTSIKKRWGKPGEELGEEHEVWELEANYISLALINYICTLSPERVILGGGVPKQTKLISLVRERVKSMLNNYIRAPQITDNIEKYIVLPKLGERAGVLGAIALAKREYEKQRH